MEFGIFPFNSYFYYLTRGFIASTRALNLPTRAFRLLTRAFILVTREFELVTRGSELVTRGFELLTRGFEPVTRFLLFDNSGNKSIQDVFKERKKVQMKSVPLQTMLLSVLCQCYLCRFSYFFILSAE